MVPERILLTYAQPDEPWARIVTRWLERASYEVETNARGRIHTMDMTAGYQRIVVLLSKAYLSDRGDWVAWLAEASADERIILVVRDETQPPLFGSRKTLVNLKNRASDESRLLLLRAIAQTRPPP